MTDVFGAVRGRLLALQPAILETHYGPFRATELRNLETQRSAFALVRGDITGEEPVLARVHSSCVTSEFYGACDCDCAAQLDGALEAIDAAGRGVLFYLQQEGRGAGLLAKARDRMIVQASRQRMTTFEAYESMGLRHDLRRYDEVAAACELLELRAPLVLLTNNPDKVEELEREKLRVVETRAIEHGASPWNAHYLSAKRRSGHALAEAPGEPLAQLPEPVECIEPEPTAEDRDRVRVASYLLPLAGERVGREHVVWLRAHFYVDLRRRSELVVLCVDDGGSGEVVARIQPEPLLERFPLARAAARAAWIETLERLDEAGSGCVVFAQRDSRGRAGEAERDGVLVDLLAHHVAGRPVVALEERDGPSLADALRGHGLEEVRVEKLRSGVPNTP
jgi:GTP cyclohydrolase II